jgi:hypothetical protein
LLKAWLRIVRLPLAPTAVADSLACALLASAAAGASMGSVLDVLALAGTSLCVYAFGMAANDWADRDTDRLKEPRRPLPSGALSPSAVAIALVLFAAGALALGGGARGERVAVAAAVLFAALYDFGLKRGVVVGSLAMGATRAANASIAVWPWVLAGEISWIVLLAPLCIGLYSTGVTLLSTTEEVEAPGRVWASRILAAIAFGVAATVAWVVGGLPTLGVGVAFGVASSTLFGRTPRPGPAKKQVLEMLLGLYWLAYVIASGGHDGSMVRWGVVALAGLVLAWGLAIGSQLIVRWLRPPPPAPT